MTESAHEQLDLGFNNQQMVEKPIKPTNRLLLDVCSRVALSGFGIDEKDFPARRENPEVGRVIVRLHNSLYGRPVDPQTVQALFESITDRQEDENTKPEMISIVPRIYRSKNDSPMVYYGPRLFHINGENYG